MISEEPQISDEWKNLWINSRRVSARFISQNANLKDISSRRKHLRQKTLPLMALHGPLLQMFGRRYLSSPV